MAKIPKLGRVIAREQGVKDPEAVYLKVEWVDDKGYRVVGGFSLTSWYAPPRAIGEKMQAALSKPPNVLYRFSRAVEQVAGKRDHPKEGQMAVLDRIVRADGSVLELREPPYTEEEEDEFYRSYGEGRGLGKRCFPAKG